MGAAPCCSHALEQVDGSGLHRPIGPHDAGRHADVFGQAVVGPELPLACGRPISGGDIGRGGGRQRHPLASRAAQPEAPSRAWWMCSRSKSVVGEYAGDEGWSAGCGGNPCSACARLARREGFDGGDAWSDEVVTLDRAEFVDGEFLVFVDRSRGDALGLEIVYHKSGLLVKAMDPGLVTSWNRRHPDLDVRNGDVIVAVNSVSQDPHRMVDECTRQIPLKMRVKRW